MTIEISWVTLLFWAWFLWSYGYAILLMRRYAAEGHDGFFFGDTKGGLDAFSAMLAIATAPFWVVPTLAVWYSIYPASVRVGRRHPWDDKPDV